MSNTTTLTDALRDSVLTAVTTRSVPITITRAGDDTWTQFKSRFLPDTMDGDTSTAGVSIETPTDERGRPATPPIQPGDLLDISFRHSHYKCSFRTPVLAVGASDGLQTSTLTLSRPGAIQRVQRRAFQRLTVPTHVKVTAEIKTTYGDSTTSINGQVADLSAGGMRLRLAARPADSPTIGQPFVITLRAPASRPISLNALYRHCNIDATGQVQWGLQIVGLDDSPRGRETLNGLTQLTRALAGRAPSGRVAQASGL